MIREVLAYSLAPSPCQLAISFEAGRNSLMDTFPSAQVASFTAPSPTWGGGSAYDQGYSQAWVGALGGSNTSSTARTSTVLVRCVHCGAEGLGPVVVWC